MSDAITHSKRQQAVWDQARYYTCMYFGLIPMNVEVSKEQIEQWIESHNRTPESLKLELEELNLLWWLVS